MASATSPSSANAILPQWQLPWCVAMPSSPKRSGETKPMADAGGRWRAKRIRPPEPTMRKTPLLATALLAAGLAACASAPATTASGEGASATEAAAMSPRRREVRRSFQALARRLAGAEPGQRDPGRRPPLRRPARPADAPGRQRIVDFSKAMLGELDAIDVNALSRENQVDAAILRNQLQGDIWNIETYQGWAWDPQVYSGLAGARSTT